MTILVSDFPSVAERMATLGCVYPETGIAILPLNFETALSIAEFRQTAESSTVKTLLRTGGVPFAEIVEKDKRPPYVHNNAFEWVVPTIFVSAGLLSQDANAVAIALSVIANYATAFFKGMGKEASVKVDIVIETTKTKTCKRVSYEGTPEGLRNLADVIREVTNE